MATRAQAQSSSHYVSQAGLSVALGALISRQWAAFSAGSITRSELRLTLYALVTRFATASATIAATDYARRRRDAGIRSPITVPRAAPPTIQQFDANLNWALAPLQDAPQTAKQNLEGAMTRLSLQAGRETTVQAVQADPQARAWARETRDGCCSFCAMLATRGAIYKSDQTAGRNANERFVGEGEFKYHNHCHCIAVPVFGTYEKTAHARQWTADWNDLKRQLGYTPSLNQWRQQFEGRAIKGLPEQTTPPA